MTAPQIPPEHLKYLFPPGKEYRSVMSTAQHNQVRDGVELVEKAAIFLSGGFPEMAKALVGLSAEGDELAAAYSERFNHAIAILGDMAANTGDGQVS
jgi:hypothetical protein